VRSFYAFDERFTGGVSVATTGDGYQPGLVVGAGPGGGPHVKVFDSQTLTEQVSFYAYDAGFTGGVNVTYINGNVFTGTVTGAPHVKAFRDTRYYGITPVTTVLPEVASFYAGDPTVTGGVSVGTATPPVWPPPEYPYYYGFGGATGPFLFTSTGNGQLARYAITSDDDYADPANPKLHTKLEAQPLETPVSGGFAGIGGLPFGTTRSPPRPPTRFRSSDMGLSLSSFRTGVILNL
jgi:hypothetical protein